MAQGIGRNPGSGDIVVRKDEATIPAIAVAASSTGSGTVPFEGAKVGDNVMFSARASLGNVSSPQAFVSAANVITLIFATGGAALTIPTQLVDISVGSW